MKGSQQSRLTVIEIQCSDLSATIVQQAWSRREARHAGNGDDVTFLLLEHARKELLDQDKVRNQIDFEDLIEEHRGRVKNRLAGA